MVFRKKKKLFPVSLQWDNSLLSLQRNLPEIDYVEFRHWEPRRLVAAHQHEDLYQLDYFPRGAGTYMIAPQQYPITPGSFFFIPPRYMHEIIGSADRRLENLTVKFRHSHLAAGFLPSILTVPEATTREAEQLFRQLISKAVLKEPPCNLVAALRLTELLVLLQHTWQLASAARDENSLVTAAKQYLVGHFAQCLSLKDIAQAVGVGGAHLCRVFKHETGMTLFEFLTRWRMEKAKDCLRQSSGRLGAIALQMGFGQTQDMNRAFQKYEGLSSRAFRRKNQPAETKPCR
ncbi:MAG: AraC family transcriptional regulator [Kiritimatiellaeota bacterium]|nr:AraC family transcriptional regulator [Kiritimatiellota bacterium]